MCHPFNPLVAVARQVSRREYDTAERTPPYPWHPPSGQVVKWFADRSDLVLLMFDAHKLDLGKEFRTVIDAIAHQGDKVGRPGEPYEVPRLGPVVWSIGRRGRARLRGFLVGVGRLVSPLSVCPGSERVSSCFFLCYGGSDSCGGVRGRDMHTASLVVHGDTRHTPLPLRRVSPQCACLPAKKKKKTTCHGP